VAAWPHVVPEKEIQLLNYMDSDDDVSLMSVV
jgi:hypothetical protein